MIITILKFIFGLILLDFYFNGIATSVSNNPVIQFILILLFFPIAYFVSKLIGINGLKGLGIQFHKGWRKNLFIGLAIGFSFWTIMYLLYYLTGKIEIKGFQKWDIALVNFLLATIGFFFGSFINGIIVRGYVFASLKNKIPMGWIFFISVLIYAFEDIWYAGFSIENTIFSIILGLSLTFAFYYTQSSWADTGIHWGLNICYGLLYGLVGSANGGIFMMKEVGTHSLLSNLILFVIPLFMFILVLRIKGIFYKNGNS